MNLSTKFVTILFILCAGLFAGRGNILFNSIESYFFSYRQSIETGDVTVREGIISVKITARRTNIKSQQLLGFLSVGRALQRTSNSFREVHIIIHYEIRGVQEILITAPVELVIQLSQGKLSPKQFFDKIGN
jgi:hypothetical protein